MQIGEEATRAWRLSCGLMQFHCGQLVTVTAPLTASVLNAIKQKKKNVVKVQMQKWNTPVGVKHVLTRKALINT